jgi:hypothetical protein
MKTTNRLLLGTAAGLMAASGAQAADMPLKAKPVQYVKICTLYGDGYYYIPGTDTCIKIGGVIQLDVGWNASGARNPPYSGTQGAQDRTVSPLSSRARGNIAMDTRTNTEYGTLRTLTSLHFQNENQTESFNVQRAFIQWAGWSFGRLQSFADVWAFNDPYINLETGQANSDTGANGVNSIAYTFDFGGGNTMTFGADERRTKSLTNLSVATALKVGAEPNDVHGGESWPDVYVNLRTNQAWGYAAVTGGAHNVNATYYSGNGTGPFAGFNVCAQASTTLCGHPGDKVGYYVQGGAEFRLPMLGPGDLVGGTVRYSVGASGFGGGGQLSSPDLFNAGNNFATGWMTDGVFVNGSGIELTTIWTVGAGYVHYWAPTFATAIGGNYANIHYDSTATGYFAGALCGVAGTGAAAQTAVSFGTGAGVAANTCSPDWHYLEVGTGARWTPVPDLSFAVEALYVQVWSGFKGGGTISASAPGARPTGIYTISNQGIFSGFFRVQRRFNTGG